MEKFLISIASIIVFLGVMRILGVYGVYTVSTPSMEPNLGVGKYIIGTKLKSPKVNDVVTYRSVQLVKVIKEQNERRRRATDFDSKSIFTSRIVAKGGDQVELKNGVIFLNGEKNEPNDFMLKYSIGEEAYLKLNKRVLPQREFYPQRIRDSILIDLSQKEIKMLQEFVEVNQHKRSNSINIFGNENWTYGNYGPIEIPAQHFFLVSDNRYAAMDSRVHGFVHEDEIVNVILN
ncbi:MAG: signal peptidase I [Saprospiraceae bacterium]